MSTTENEEPEEKKYCCGNSAQNEAGYVSKCDLALAVTGLAFFTLVTVVLFVDESILISYVEANPAMRDLTKLIEAEQLHQIAFLTAAMIWLFFELGLAILLLRGAFLRDKALLNKWFYFTLVMCGIGGINAIFAGFFLDEKTYVVGGAIVYYLYKWYGLWICTELLKEIKLGINAYTIPCEF